MSKVSSAGVREERLRAGDPLPSSIGFYTDGRWSVRPIWSPCPDSQMRQANLLRREALYLRGVSIPFASRQTNTTPGLGSSLQY